jgi:Helix-turn-helix domain
MTRKQPPPDYLTSSEAAEILKCSVSMVYTYERSGRLKKEVPKGRKQGFFKRSEVEALAAGMAEFFEMSLESQVPEMSDLVFAQATPDDAEGIYKVAASLFGTTTSAELRKPLIALCPQGNYIVKWREKIVAYIHIQPLKHEQIMAFMNGKIRGPDLSVNDLDCFAPEKSVECLVKSIGAVKDIGPDDSTHRLNQLHFLFKLLRGTALEIEKLGAQGIDITKLYATSETITGIEMAYSAHMEMFGKPFKGSRFRYVLDVQQSDIPLLRPYKHALAEWQQAHKEPTTVTHEKS